jgi:hypothetical protein
VVREFLFESSPEDNIMLSCPIMVSSCLAKLDRQVALDIRKINPTYYMTLDPTGLMAWASGNPSLFFLRLDLLPFFSPASPEKPPTDIPP